MDEPGPSPVGSKRGHNSRESSEGAAQMATPANRRVRPRKSFGSPTQQGLSLELVPVIEDYYEFLVYLPNSTSLVKRVDGATCKNMTVADFVELVRFEQSLLNIDVNMDIISKKKQRDIKWKSKVYITDFQGNPISNKLGALCLLGDEIKAGRGLLLYDNDPDIVHSHQDFWNVTPETHLLEMLPQDYSVFSALADELDNSLQAVYQMQPDNRLICVDLDHITGKITIYDTGKGMDGSSQNSISKWGTMGSSVYRRSVHEAIGIPPPYLKPNFGMFGLGGIGAGLHLGGCITVSSKTKLSKRVAVLHIAKEALERNIKGGSVWKTGGEFRPPKKSELQWSIVGSFTKVEISKLNSEITTWRVAEVQRKLKDFYFPYIQNDNGVGGLTSRPVEIRVNGEDLAGILGGEVAHTNYFSGVGEPFVLILELTKSRPGGAIDKANARITCLYFPVNKGIEAIDCILEKLEEEDPKFAEPGVIGEANFENYSRRCVRRLGRLLPRARGGRLPFMEPKRFHKENEVNKHCYKRAKAFIDVDAGFVPTHSKTDLDPNHSFTEALLKLGSGLQTVDSTRGLVTVSITRDGVVVKPEYLYVDYKLWITKNHDKLDSGAVIDQSSAIIVAQPHHKEELCIKDDVFRVVYDIKCGDYNWKVGKEEAPIRLKLMKGLQGLNNNDLILYATVLYTTVECFISEGLADVPGETRIICRSMGVPEERGSREVLDDQNQEHSFILGDSRAFPIEILFSGKCEVVDEAVWRKQGEKAQTKSPAFVELLHDQESFPNHANLEAGAALPSEFVAVVRPKLWKDHMTSKDVDSKRLKQNYIISDPMEMSLIVWKMKYQPPAVDFPKSQMLKSLREKNYANVEELYVKKVTASSTLKNLKGLYCFSVAGNELELIKRTRGTYFLFFALASEKYQDVDAEMVRINVAPASKVGKWTLCSHPGLCKDHHLNEDPAMMKVRIAGVLPEKLYLTKFDEFGNPKEFEEIPRDIKCEIYSREGHQVKISATISEDLLVIPDDDRLNLEIPMIRIGQGNLDMLKPKMQATLRIIVAGIPVAGFSISVLPGELASARMKECEVPDNGLHPGQIIEKAIFEILDKHQNPVSFGEQVKVVLDGFAFQDKVGHTRSVDKNGCLDLGVRLRVTAGYGDEACLELQSTANFSLWKKSSKIVNRSLRIKNAPDRVAFGSQLTGLEIEAVDENGQVDHAMDGIAHNLTLDWNPNISVPLHRGECTLPPVKMRNPGMWEGCVAHSQYSNLKTRITVRVDEPLKIAAEEETNHPIASENLCDMSSGPVALLDELQSKALALQGDPATDEDPRLASQLQAAINSDMDKTKKIQSKIFRLGRKLKKQEDELQRFKDMKEDHEKSMQQNQREIDMLTVMNPANLNSNASESLMASSSKKAKLHNAATSDDQVETYYTSTEETPGSIHALACSSTPEQVEMQVANFGMPPGTNAAAILLQARRQQNCGNLRDIIGIVALLGAVENEEINRALVAFLGSENMQAIITGSTRAPEFFGTVKNDGNFDPNQGIFGLAQSRNLQISGRFRVITLADESSFYKRSDGRQSVNHSDPQKLLNMRPVTVASVGSLGYAVNLIRLNPDQLRIRIRGRYGLRESLFFVLFGYLEVFDTTVNMLRARKEIKSSAVSLDGGRIRSSNQFEWGEREDYPVWFPKWVPATAGQVSVTDQGNEEEPVVQAPPRRSIPFKEARPVQYKQRKELLKAANAARQSYIDKGVEINIQKLTEQADKTNCKINAAIKNMEECAARCVSTFETAKSRLNPNQDGC